MYNCWDDELYNIYQRLKCATVGMMSYIIIYQRLRCATVGTMSYI